MSNVECHEENPQIYYFISLMKIGSLDDFLGAFPKS